VRTPPQYNVDAVVQKDLGLAGSWKGQLRLEVLNVLNRPNVRALQGANTVGSSNFGQTNLQSGFMRVLQFSFRMSF
jgi:hypothetical protein